MPSYIEIDKQASFPPSSNIGKLVFGFNTSEQACITDNLGNTSVIGGGGGGTGIQIPTPMIGITGSNYDLVVHFLDQGFDFTQGNPELFLFRWKKSSRKKVGGVRKKKPSGWVHPSTDGANVKWQGWKFFGGGQVSAFNNIGVTGRTTEFEIPSTIKPYERFSVNFNKYMFWYTNLSGTLYDINVFPLGSFDPTNHQDGEAEIRLTNTKDDVGYGKLGNIQKYCLAVGVDNPAATKTNGLSPKIFGDLSEPFYSVYDLVVNDIKIIKENDRNHFRVIKSNLL
jgi:hypothetical protein